jgi:hypothetical protein
MVPDIITWVGDGPPPDHPMCGFEGELCVNGKFNIIAINSNGHSIDIMYNIKKNVQVSVRRHRLVCTLLYIYS